MAPRSQACASSRQLDEWSARRRSPELNSGRAPSQGARAARSQGRPKGASQAPGASRRSIPRLGKRKKGSGLPGADQRTRAAKLGCLTIESVKAMRRHILCVMRGLDPPAGRSTLRTVCAENPSAGEGPRIHDESPHGQSYRSPFAAQPHGLPAQARQSTYFLLIALLSGGCQPCVSS